MKKEAVKKKIEVKMFFEPSVIIKIDRLAKKDGRPRKNFCEEIIKRIVKDG